MRKRRASDSGDEGKTGGRRGREARDVVEHVIRADSYDDVNTTDRRTFSRAYLFLVAGPRDWDSTRLYQRVKRLRQSRRRGG